MKRSKEFSAKQQEAIEFIGRRLRQIRLDRGYTNYEYLSYELGMSRSLYGRYEKGANITIASLVKILEHYNMTLEEFFVVEGENIS
jgi:transcriptional regulator with XRE-family HTH domain